MQGPAEQAADEFDTELLVSIVSCLRCGVLACGRLHNAAVLGLAWGISSCHGGHSISALFHVMLAELHNPSCHAGTCRAGSRRV